MAGHCQDGWSDGSYGLSLLTDAFEGLGNGGVLGAEGVAPLRDAVRLVHGYPGHSDLRQSSHEFLRPEPLGADVEQLVVAAFRSSQHVPPLALRHTAVDGRHLGDAAGAEVLDLVVHQGGER